MDLTDSVVRYLTRAPTSDFVLQPVEVLDHWSGDENLLWRVRCHDQDVVLKLFMDAGQARSRRQYDGQTMFSSLGLAPYPLWYDRYPEGLSRQILVYKWQDGERFEPARQDHCARLARAVAEIHSAESESVHRLCPAPINLTFYARILSGTTRTVREQLRMLPIDLMPSIFDKLTDDVQSRIERALPLWDQAPPVPVHGDLVLSNVGIDPNLSVRLFDWEFFGLGDPGLEVSSFLHRFAIENLDVDAWLATYLAAMGDPTLAQRIAAYQSILPYRDVAYLIMGITSRPSAAAAGARAVDGTVNSFLSETLGRALDRAATTQEVAIDPAQIAPAVAELFGSLPET